MSIRLRENHGFNLIHVQVMQIWHILSCELHGSPIALSKHEVCSFRDILILIHLLHAGTFRLSEGHLPLKQQITRVKFHRAQRSSL